MNRWLVLGVGLGAVLGAAVVYSLMGEAHDEAAATSAAPGPRHTPRTGSAGVDERRGVTSPAEAPPGEPPGAEAPLMPLGSTGVVEPTSTGEAPPPLAESPFATENSAEIDYAFELAIGPDSGVDSARAAIDVFDRCLKAAPQNRRCYDGLVAAQQRLEPGWTPPAPPQQLAPMPGAATRPTRALPPRPTPQGPPAARPMDFRKR